MSGWVFCPLLWPLVHCFLEYLGELAHLENNRCPDSSKVYGYNCFWSDSHVLKSRAARGKQINQPKTPSIPIVTRFFISYWKHHHSLRHKSVVIRHPLQNVTPKKSHSKFFLSAAARLAIPGLWSVRFVMHSWWLFQHSGCLGNTPGNGPSELIIFLWFN